MAKRGPRSLARLTCLSLMHLPGMVFIHMMMRPRSVSIHGWQVCSGNLQLCGGVDNRSIGRTDCSVLSRASFFCLV